MEKGFSKRITAKLWKSAENITDKIGADGIEV
jgi:hypothetical protein